MLSLSGREVGVNRYGEPVTAVVVEHLADEDVAKRGKQLSSKARAALGKLWELINDRSRSFPITDQPGLRCVLLRDLETACVAHGVLSQSPESKQRRRLFRDALTELQDVRAVILDGAARERVYPAPTAHRDGDDYGPKSTSDDLEERLARLRRRDVPPPSVAGQDASDVGTVGAPPRGEAS